MGTLLAGVLGAPLHWRAALLALLSGLAGLFLWKHPRACAGLLALGAAPLWIAAASDGGGRLVLLVAVGGLILHRSGLPRAVPWLVIGMALLQALRLSLLGPVVAAAAAMGLPLAASGLAAAGAATAPPERRTAAVLLLVGGGLCLGAWQARQVPLASASDAQAAAAWGVLVRDVLPEGEAAEASVRRRPDWHALAMSLPPQAALDAGWRPHGAPLSPEDRVTVSRLLERRGRGGEGRRLLRSGDDASLAWWLTLFTRLEGRDRAWEAGPIPAEALRLPGAHSLEQTLSVTGDTELLLHAEQALVSVSLRLSGEWYEGPPELQITLDDVSTRLQVSREERLLPLGALSGGPHRLQLRFLNDLQGEDGDRNITVHVLTGE